MAIFIFFNYGHPLSWILFTTTSQLVTWPTRHTVNSWHSQLVTVVTPSTQYQRSSCLTSFYVYVVACRSAVILNILYYYNRLIRANVAKSYW